MARYRVQFQKGLSETRFDELYGSADRCREAVFRWRWPRGFVCPGCGRQKHCVIKTRNLYQCTSCRRQTSLIAGTIFASTKVPLRTWFRAMYPPDAEQGRDRQPRTRLGVTQNRWRCGHPPSSGSIPRSATSRPPSPPPSGPSASNTSPATWPNSPTASIDATISPP